MSKKCDRCGSFALDDALECSYCGETFDRLDMEEITKEVEEDIHQPMINKNDVVKKKKIRIRFSLFVGIVFIIFWMIYFIYIGIEAIKYFE